MENTPEGSRLYTIRKHGADSITTGDFSPGRRTRVPAVKAEYDDVRRGDLFVSKDIYDDYLLGLSTEEIAAHDAEPTIMPYTVREYVVKKTLEPLYPDHVSEVLPWNGEKLDITVNKEHAYEVLDTLLAAYENNGLPYSLDRVRLPHDPRHMPKTLVRGSTDHAMFLFNVCYYMRGGIKSNDAVKRMSDIYDSWPELFSCEEAMHFDPTVIEDVLRTHGLGFQRTVANQWVENSKRMHNSYNGDPRNIFHGVQSYERSQELIQNNGKGEGFIGFQEKMTSMIIYYLADEELIDPFNFPIPVDLHVMRVSIANEMITFGDAPYGTDLFRKETTAALRGLYMDYAVDRGVDPLRVCDAVWMLSESSCGRHPGNTTIEPLGRKMRSGRKTILIPKVVDVNDPVQQKAYAESCGICPIECTCKFNIPGTPYYVGGHLIKRGPRVQLPMPVVRPGIEPLF